MKKTIYALFLCLCVIFLSSCGRNIDVTTQVFETNAFRLVRQVNSEGNIGLAYVFPLNASELNGLGYSESQVLAFRFYLTSYVNALAQTNREKETEGAKVGSAQYFDDVDGIGFVIKFEDLAAQKRFFGVENSQQNSSNKNSSGFLLKKTKMITNFPFSKTSAGNLKMISLMAISSWANDQDLSEDQREKVKDIFDQSVFIYDFSSQQTSIKSELMYDDEGFHHNVFVKSQHELEENCEIEFWTISPNYPIWYGSALVGVLVAMLFSFYVFKKKNKR